MLTPRITVTKSLCEATVSHPNKRNHSFQSEICTALIFKHLKIHLIIFSITRVICILQTNVFREGIWDFYISERKMLVHSWEEGDLILKK